MINDETDIVLLQQEPVKSAVVEDLNSFLLIGRHESVLQTLPDFPHRQFLRYTELVDLSEFPSLPGLVVVELPRLQKQCTAKYKAMENLVSSFDWTQINLCDLAAADHQSKSSIISDGIWHSENDATLLLSLY